MVLSWGAVLFLIVRACSKMSGDNHTKLESAHANLLSDPIL